MEGQGHATEDSGTSIEIRDTGSGAFGCTLVLCRLGGRGTPSTRPTWGTVNDVSEFLGAFVVDPLTRRPCAPVRWRRPTSRRPVGLDPPLFVTAPTLFPGPRFTAAFRSASFGSIAAEPSFSSLPLLSFPPWSFLRSPSRRGCFAPRSSPFAPPRACSPLRLPSRLPSARSRIA